MKRIEIGASRSYPVLIGHDLYEEIPIHISSVCSASKIAIISDSNVWPLYGDTIADALKSFEICHYVFPAGEGSKNGQTYLDLLNFLASNGLTRKDCIIALGGGVVGDLAGFAAATYMRGISYVQIPTTLLAMVDSSVGGKTAIDLPAGKNLAGAFYQPNLVLCDLNSLQTLPPAVFADGCAEVIKYGVLFDAELFTHLSERKLSFDREYVISKCIDWKRYVVQKDEFEHGLRQKLNLGHTIGHSIETLSNHKVSHGQAVAVGMAIIARAAARIGLCSTENAKLICQTITDFGLPTATDFAAQDLFTSALSDKKREANTVNLIIPERIGRCSIYPTAITELQSFIEAGI